ncbi:MAG: hypothetical protein KAX49_12745 [Halanaerobiales bacterium]|nr:hypothetical protein [Halanaerobiales bacterium]
MDKFKQIYDLLFSPIVTPYNLLDNIKLPNYEYINYYKGDQGIICELKCDIEDEGEGVFFYYFDSEDKLDTITVSLKKADPIVIFKRSEELQIELHEYLESRKNNQNIAQG